MFGRGRRRALLAVSLAIFVRPASVLSRSDSGRRKNDADSKAAPTLGFEPNLGQTDPAVRFTARGVGFMLSLTDRGAELALRGGAPEGRAFVLGVRVARGDHSRPIPGDPLKGRANYFRGRDPAQWIVDVPRYARVTYPNVRPGVSLVFHGEEGRLEYDFVVAPGATAQDVVVEISGSQGLTVDESGALLVHTLEGVVRQPAPTVYQEDLGGAHEVVRAGYRLVDASRVGFAVAAYDSARPLVIDPVLLYASYLGGSSFDDATAVALDPSGNVYVAGFTTSSDFPTKNSIAPLPGWGGGASPNGSTDAFIAKLDSSGTELDFATYLGGTSEDAAYAIAVDSSGAAYVTGATGSTDFPTTSGVYQPQNGGASNAFVAKLTPDGRSLAFSTYLGGSGYDSAQAIALDALENVYIAGFTQSPDFPTVTSPGSDGGTPSENSPTAYQSSLMGAQNAFVAKLSPDAASLLGSTYLGGSGNDAAAGLAVDALGDAYVAGYTQSIDFPRSDHAYQTKLGGCTPGPACPESAQNAFVSELSPLLVALDFSTFLGGSGQDAANAIALDSAGNVYVAGATTSTDFPTAGAYQAHNAGTQNAFVTKLSAGGSSLVYSTFLGGSASDLASGLCLDSSGDAYLVGQTQSRDFPLQGAFQTSNLASSSPDGDAFFAILGATGQTLLGSTYLGGEGGARGQGVALGLGNVAWIVGGAGPGLPTKNPLFADYTAQPPDGQNAFLAQVSSEAGAPSVDASPPEEGTEGGAGRQVDGGDAPESSDEAGVVVVGPSLVAPLGGSSGCGCHVRESGDGVPWPIGTAFFAGALGRRRRCASPRVQDRS
jgi:hypothetical protein